jgi:quinol monooxygenase YgiN
VIIVAGWLRVAPENRAPYLENCHEVIAAARAAHGCIDFHLSADALDDGRINIFEQWESADAVDAFRGSGPSDDQQSMIADAHVEQHEIASTISLT